MPGAQEAEPSLLLPALHTHSTAPQQLTPYKVFFLTPLCLHEPGLTQVGEEGVKETRTP